MSRKKIPQDTKYFTYYNANPYERYTTDCVIRAVCTATEEDWYDTVISMTRFLAETGHVFHDNDGIGMYLEALGWTRMSQPKFSDGSKMPGYAFCEWLRSKGCTGNVVVNMGRGHTSVMLYTDDGYKFFDTWNVSFQKVGVWWYKED